MKKFRVFVLTAFLAVGIIVQGIPAHAEELNITAPSGVLMDASTRRVLFGKNPH